MAGIISNTYMALQNHFLAPPQAAKVAEFSIASISLAVGGNSTEVSFEEWTYVGDDDSGTVIVAVALIDMRGGETGEHSFVKGERRLAEGRGGYCMLSF